MTEDKVIQTIVVRKDLGMRAGKQAAQVSHASMIFLIEKLKQASFFHTCSYVEMINTGYITFAPPQYNWLFDGKFTKIVLRVESEQELLNIYDRSIEAGLTCHKVVDEGLTEFHGVPTLTSIAIGPDYKSKIDPITKDLKCL